MKRFLLLSVLVFGLICSSAFSAGDKASKDGTLRKSKFSDETGTSFPIPFNETSQSVSSAAISTGYYFIDSDDEAPDYWRPVPSIVDTTTEPTTWRRIMAGPRILTGTDGTYRKYWLEHPEDGLRFFRNPAVPGAGFSYNFFLDGNNYATDSTDDAIAGPIPIGFGFHFNGLRYDSFYVSSNGCIALTNRRYTYDNEGFKSVGTGATDCYDPMSQDWYARGRNGDDGLTDGTTDDYGYYYAVCGGNPLSQNAGIRSRNGGSLEGIGNYSAVIAPFWGDLHLSQYNAAYAQVDDWGRVYYKKSFANDKLIIYFVNIAPVRTKYNPLSQSYTAPFDLRPGDYQYTSANCQVTLDNTDSSVVICYERFDGVAVISGRGYPASSIFRASTTVGVTGYARHINYGQSGGPTYPWGGTYSQTTHYYNSLRNPNVIYPHNYLAIKFKQWKNTLRVVDIQYRIRKATIDANLDFAPEGCPECIIKSSQVNNFELLAGEEKIGAIQPMSLIQNLTNNIQGPGGVNFQNQQVNFRARFRIVNLATQRIVYNRLVPIDSICLSLEDSLSQNCTGDPYVRVRYSQVTKSGADYTAKRFTPLLPNNYNGIPPYGFVQVFFPPFEPNEFVDNHIGRLKSYIICDPTNPTSGEGLGDQWPFDDTTSAQLFVMRRMDEFKDDVTQFHLIERVLMPSVLKWVNIDAEVNSGDEVSLHPLAPRGQYDAANSENNPLKSPVIRMDRKHLDGSDWSTGQTDYNGDQIRSFPIDMRERKDAVLSMSFQRTFKQSDWPRGWCDQQLVGPEPRTFTNADLVSQFGYYYVGSAYTYTNAASRYPDEIDIELMQPSPDGLTYIANVPDKRWRNHPRRNGAKPVTDMPAYRLYGSNGYDVAFLETDKDSSLSPIDFPGVKANAFRPRLFDEGIDYEYRKAFVTIPDTFITAPKEGAKNFRFRVKVYASNDKKCLTCIPDDDDPFYVDNVRILFPSEITDIEVSSVKILWPYTIAPASQATKIPITVKISNNTSITAPTFWVKVKIFRGKSILPAANAIYCRTQQLPILDPGVETEVTMPSWNARTTGPGDYRLLANVVVPGGDLEPLNDTTYFDVNLRYGDVFAYDPPDNARNDVQDGAFTGIIGRGLNLFAFAEGGIGSVYGWNGGWDKVQYEAGYTGGSGSGQIGMKFTLVNSDTIYGYQAFFCMLNQALDDVSLAVYTDMGGNQPGQRIANSVIYRQRTWDDIRKEPFIEEYVTYMLPAPLVLPAGTYWAVIGQMGETGLELGASKSRMGMRTTSTFIPPPVYVTNYIGASGIHLMIEKNFRKMSQAGNNLINNNLFCVENTRGSGTWLQFMPTVGNPAYAHLGHYGVTDDNTTATLSRGGWVPMIRPFLGKRSYGNDTKFNPCLDDIYPVELTSFNAYKRSGGVDLMWETASEVNNFGFYVERRIASDDNDWASIGFVKGVGNSKSTNSYQYFDGDVTLNTTYQYRLRQVDMDGSQNCNTTDIITVTIDQVSSVTLDQNRPNPFTNNTVIGFNLPEKMNVKLEVLDIFGNVIATLMDGELPGTHHEFPWEGVDMNGNKVANGTYIYRLSAGNDVLSSKMTLIR